MRGTKRRRLLCCSVILVATTGVLPASGQTRRATLEELLRLHDSLHDEERARHLESRRREREALERMDELASELDRALDDSETTPAELRALEIDLTDAREATFARFRESAELRREIYRRMDLLAELRRELELLRGPGPGGDPITGRWRFESTTRPTRTSAAPVPARPEEAGTLELQLQGTIVSGSYRLESGESGSLRGTFSGNRIDLVRIDAVRGEDMTLEGTFDPATGELAGVWRAKELAAGRPAAGEWSAYGLEDEP